MKNEYEIRGDVTAIFMKRKDGELHEAIIDTISLKRISWITSAWCASKNYGGYYVLGRVGDQRFAMHRMIMDAPNGMHVDHINHNTFDNRFSNLRIVTPGQNLQNKLAYKQNKTGIRGVHWNKRRQKWCSQVGLNGRKVHVRFFDDLLEAEKDVKAARLRWLPFSLENTSIK